MHRPFRFLILSDIPLDRGMFSLYYIHYGHISAIVGIYTAIRFEEKEKKMPPSNRDPEELLPLTPAVLHILLSLVDEEKHGYSIMREITVQTKGKLHVGPTTLYRSIKQLLEAGLIEESDKRPDPALDDERRHYYRITQFGRLVTAAEVRRLNELLAIAQAKQGIRDLLPAPAPSVRRIV